MWYNKDMEQLKAFIWDWVKSSQDPQKLSLTLKSAASTLATLGILFGVVLPQEDVDSVAHGVEVLVAAVWAGISGVGILYGVFRKFKKPKG